MTEKDKDKGAKEQPGSEVDDLSIDRPRLTPRASVDPSGGGNDSTDPMGEGAKHGQGDKAEG